jgi:nucleoside-diphosphate-sugar epimerase
MRLLVLGGTHFVGRAVVEAALADGIDVTTLNRGLSPIPGADVRTLVADRTDPAALREAIGDEAWDAVIDTWSGAPRAVADSCRLLARRTGHFGYVSTISVYADPLPMGVGEHAAVVDGDPDSDDSADYAAAKRGSELAALRVFGAGALLARPGMILGPYENIGRLPWWLRRIERGGRVLAPGDPARPVQYVDARDLARWMLDAARRHLSGAFNVVSQPGHTTMGELLSTALLVTGAVNAELVWAPDKLLLDAGISPWTELPIWLPRDSADDAVYSVDVSAAHAAGLSCRPPQDTVAGTWAWLQAEGDPPPRPGRTPVGLDPAKERQVLDILTAGPA